MTLSDWIALVALLVAVGSLAAAWRADQRAGDAFRLQDRIDAREREFRAVSWHGKWADDVSAADPPTFELTNTGLTAAQDVTLVIDFPRGPQAFRLGNIEAGASARAGLHSQLSGTIAAAVLDRRDTRFDVHWSSPLGQADSFHHPGLQLY
ncbi:MULTISPECIES: hypothetical protein [Microbacterium]|uniref:Uncharacterized protein n=1 Tax=Microbacterium hominis TaxID=162426 RepID=A0A2K9D736_9MICO|nr:MULTISPECIES: hypothetical protein [Microbacterium]AUG29425.1 hypothetical protein CXR34_08095 [Microbacterium hominis]EPD84116.1 hypothetical protein HMPREF1529_02156 [Microbacterium sp. oral taxon 186 str. F0373]